MRILVVTNLYPRAGHDTLAPFNRQQFAAMARDHPLVVVAPVPWTEELGDLNRGRRTPRRTRSAEGIEVHHPRYYFPPRMFRSSYGRFYLASIRRLALGIARDFRPEVVLACWAHPDGWAAVRLAREIGIPSVIKVVGSDVLVVKGSRRRERMAEGLREADAVVTVSRDLADRVIALGVKTERVRVVYNGLDASRFRPSDRRAARERLGLPTEGKIVLFVGNILLSKGVGILAEAIALLALRGVAVRGYFVGKGRDDGVLRGMISRLGIAGSSTMAGPKPHDQVPDWIHSCDVVVLPSFSEGIPNVLVEASACGRPFVATRVGGIPEIAGDEHSRLVPPGDPKAVADAILEVFEMGEVPVVPGSTWAESAESLANVLRWAVDGRSDVDNAKVR